MKTVFSLAALAALTALYLAVVYALTYIAANVALFVSGFIARRIAAYKWATRSAYDGMWCKGKATPVKPTDNDSAYRAMLDSVV